MEDFKGDAEQVKFMDEDLCILVDDNDVAHGHASKRVCHLNTTIREGKALHRAFSVFLFNSKGELLLQQRSGTKITFPLRWTNTCCSHPLYTDEEREEKDNLGVKRAALRKMEHELGIPLDTISLDEIHHLTRIRYQALSDGLWGEHEVDHIMFIQKDDVPIKLNENEIAAVEYVTAERLKEMFTEQTDGKLVITPWFQMICEKFLFDWWAQLDTIIKNKGLGPEMSAKIHPLSMDDAKPAEAAATA